MAGFLSFNNRFSSMTCDWNILSSVQLQNFYSHLGECIEIPWGSLTLMVFSLPLFNSIHQWLVIKWFLPCLTSRHLFTWLESYRLGFGMKDLAVRIHWQNCLSSGCDGRLFGVMTWIHIVCLVAMSILGSDNMDLLCMLRRHVPLSMPLIMDLQYILGSHDMVILMDL